MVALEAVLAICGVVCVLISFVIEGKDEPAQKSSAPVQTDLTQSQKDEIRRQVNDLVNEELSMINERTEASLDKISNTKILEMNDYADTVIGEINKSHNEAVFLYDMLNEKAKEVKNTVKDVNIAKHEVKRLQDEISAEPQEIAGDILEEANTVRDVAKERLTKLVRESNEKARISETQGKSENQAGQLKSIVNGDKPINVSADEVLENTPENIVLLYRSGLSVRDIARKFGLGVGEVSLIIGLHDKDAANE